MKHEARTGAGNSVVPAGSQAPSVLVPSTLKVASWSQNVFGIGTTARRSAFSIRRRGEKAAGTSASAVLPASTAPAGRVNWRQSRGKNLKLGD